MTSYKEEFREDADKSPKDLEHEIDETRARMEHTLDLLERKLSPSDMFEEAFRVVRRNSGTFAHNLSTEVQNKPLPALLAGVGLAWLMAGPDGPPVPRSSSTGRPGAFSRRAREMAQSAREGLHDLGDKAHEVGDRTSSMGDRARGRAEDVGDRFQDMSRRAGDSLSHAGERAQERAHQVREAARRGGQRAKEQYEHLLHDQPLLLGGLGLALGAAIGAMMPRTELEDRTMGEHSERMKREASEEARKVTEEAKASAERVAGAAQEQLSKEQQARSQEYGDRGHQQSS
jgi:ElaB/YqjD/DUF883 family membrane-anchored ribosome-binding protein